MCTHWYFSTPPIRPPENIYHNHALRVFRVFVSVCVSVCVLPIIISTPQPIASLSTLPIWPFNIHAPAVPPRPPEVHTSAVPTRTRIRPREKCRPLIPDRAVTHPHRSVNARTIATYSMPLITTPATITYTINPTIISLVAVLVVAVATNRFRTISCGWANNCEATSTTVATITTTTMTNVMTKRYRWNLYRHRHSRRKVDVVRVSISSTTIRCSTAATLGNHRPMHRTPLLCCTERYDHITIIIRNTSATGIVIITQNEKPCRNQQQRI